MIEKYQFGTPFETDAVIVDLPLTSTLPKCIINNENTLTLTLDDSDIVYGLGENVRGINKRGWVYDSFLYG